LIDDDALLHVVIFSSAQAASYTLPVAVVLCLLAVPATSMVSEHLFKGRTNVITNNKFAFKLKDIVFACICIFCLCEIVVAAM